MFGSELKLILSMSYPLMILTLCEICIYSSAYICSSFPHRICLYCVHYIKIFCTPHLVTKQLLLHEYNCDMQ